MRKLNIIKSFGYFIASTVASLALLIGPVTGVVHAEEGGTVTISGTVTGPNGQLLGDINVILTNPETGEEVTRGWTNSVQSPYTEVPFGQYQFDVPAGTYNIKFAPGDYEARDEWSTVDETNIALTENTVMNEQLRILSASHMLSGRLTDGNGNPIAGTWIQTQGHPGPSNYVKTDSDGNYSFTLAENSGQDDGYNLSAYDYNTDINESRELPQMFYISDNTSLPLYRDVVRDMQVPKTRTFTTQAKGFLGLPTALQDVSLINFMDVTPGQPQSLSESATVKTDLLGNATFTVFDNYDIVIGTGASVCTTWVTDNYVFCNNDTVPLNVPYLMNEAEGVDLSLL
jgi:hypothetical protein